jgi:hypothetical protein
MNELVDVLVMSGWTSSHPPRLCGEISERLSALLICRIRRNRTTFFCSIGDTDLLSAGSLTATGFQPGYQPWLAEFSRVSARCGPACCAGTART